MLPSLLSLSLSVLLVTAAAAGASCAAELYDIYVSLIVFMSCSLCTLR
jgi:hypothetical protein